MLGTGIPIAMVNFAAWMSDAVGLVVMLSVAILGLVCFFGYTDHEMYSCTLSPSGKEGSTIHSDTCLTGAARTTDVALYTVGSLVSNNLMQVGRGFNWALITKVAVGLELTQPARIPRACLSPA